MIIPSLWFFSPQTWIYGVGVEVGGGPGGPRDRRVHPRGGVPPYLVDSLWAPWCISFAQKFLLIPKSASVDFQDIPRTFISTQNSTMAILLKTTLVRVSSIQIMQVRVQNKGKSVWKSRYVGDVSTPPTLNLCLSSSNLVDKLKVRKKNFYELFCSCLHK